jgi:hypothetical protein
VCNDNRWFTSFTPFASRLRQFRGSGETVVFGVGTVILPVKSSPNGSAHSQLVLNDVLYCPFAEFNIVGPLFGYNINMDSNTHFKGTIHENGGQKQVAYFDPKAPLYKIKLSGPPVGPAVAPSVLREDGNYVTLWDWSNAERQRWKMHRETINNPQKNTPQEVLDAQVYRATHPDTPYTAEEIQWLKKTYGDEYHFLTGYGLSINKEWDRATGRAILRVLLADGDGWVWESEDEDEEEIESDSGENYHYDSSDDDEGELLDDNWESAPEFHFDKKTSRWMATYPDDPFSVWEVMI